MLTNEDEEVNFWEAVQLYTERLFLIPSLPSGMLAMVSGRVHQREGEYSLCCYPLWLFNRSCSCQGSPPISPCGPPGEVRREGPHSLLHVYTLVKSVELKLPLLFSLLPPSAPRELSGHSSPLPLPLSLSGQSSGGHQRSSHRTARHLCLQLLPYAHLCHPGDP